MEMDQRKQQAIDLLKDLIKTPSFSGEEDQTAEIIMRFLESHGLNPQRKLNNVWCATAIDPDKKTVLLNSHHDTVRPGKSWTYDPFGAVQEEDKITGLGSNDAGASAVSMLASFVYLQKHKLPYNLIVAITAEEENSGRNNVTQLYSEWPEIDLALVGEPTQMDMAIAERGLVVLDCYAHGKTGHAARKEGENAIYKAMADLEWFRTYQFDKVSDFLGPVGMTVTQIEAGKQHNVVPDLCHWVVDVRVNEHYSNREIAELIQDQVNCEVKPRSYRLNSSRIDPQHPIVRKGEEMGLKTYGSPTLSDQAVMPFTSVKIGPGDSARSHTPDEYIYIHEIKKGIDIYISLLTGFSF